MYNQLYKVSKFLYSKIPAHIIEQIEYRKEVKDHKILSAKDWESFKEELRGKLVFDLFIKRKQWIIDNLNEKTRAKYGIEFKDEHTISIDFEKCPHAVIQKLNEIR